MKTSFLKLAAVFAILVIGGAIAFNHFTGAKADYSRGDIENIVKDYLQDNPKVIVDALQKYQLDQQLAQQREQQQQFLANKGKLLESKTSPVVGSDAKDAVLVVEFFDYNCGYCKRAIDAVNQLVDEEKDVKFVFKELPILSATSKTAAEYALASQEQGKYMEYHTALMKHQGAKTEDILQDIAKEVGLDVDKLKEDAKSSKIQKELDDNRALAELIGVRGTPAFIIGDEFSPGYIPYEQMKAFIEKARQEG